MGVNPNRISSPFLCPKPGTTPSLAEVSSQLDGPAWGRPLQDRVIVRNSAWPISGPSGVPIRAPLPATHILYKAGCRRHSQRSDGPGAVTGNVCPVPPRRGGYGQTPDPIWSPRMRPDRARSVQIRRYLQPFSAVQISPRAGIIASGLSVSVRVPPGPVRPGGSQRAAVSLMALAVVGPLPWHDMTRWGSSPIASTSSADAGTALEPAVKNVPLTAQEISNLDAALMAATRMHSQLRAEIPAARFISRPPIPAVLSESLVGYSTHWLFGDACTVTFGGTRADLIVRRPLGDQLLVEVKATGVGEFQEVKPRDLAADVLVWVAFGSRYVNASGPTDIYVLPQPRRFEPPTTRSGVAKRKFELKDFLAGASELSGFTVWRFVDIGSLGPGVGPRALSPPRDPFHRASRTESSI
jgi:hypothetical protein